MVIGKSVPNFGSELRLGRVSWHLANTRTRTYNASEYLKKNVGNDVADMNYIWTIYSHVSPFAC